MLTPCWKNSTRRGSRKRSSLESAINKSYCSIVIDGSGPHTDRFFTYAVPEELRPDIELGQYIRVPWGKGEKTGFVRAFSATLPDELSPSAIKPISSILDSRALIGDGHWKLAAWLRAFYFGSWPEAVRCLIPGPVLQGLKRQTKGRKRAAEILEATDQAPTLTTEQASVWGCLESELGRPTTFLLHGVTGSGKTELYLRATERILSQGKQALVLVPEVSLTPQTRERYRKRFGPKVCILHSGLTPAQRRHQWWRIRDGEAEVVVGTRSAVFAPLKRCGLIILDEEHDSSYKQASEIRYHARQVAAWLSRENGCTVILGSATPSLESFTLAQQGRYQYLQLTKRVGGQQLPAIRLLEGRELPHQALQAVEACRQRGEQSVILLNRRGFSNFLQCDECGWVPECKSCSISLTYHKRARSLRCHYCGFSRKAPARCEDCQSPRLEYAGRGTERLEQELAQRLPELRVSRLDRDTVGGRSAVFEETFTAFRQGELDCLLGTQMVAKGLDFPKVTLVVVLQADTGLHVPDFRAAERTFSLLTQVSGRAGRAELPGEVMIVCRRPDLPLFQDLLSHNWGNFASKEQQARRDFRYPPYSRLLRLLLSDEKEERLERVAMEVGDLLAPELAEHGVEMLGPAPCPLERLQGRYRWHILLRAAQVQDLQTVVRKIGPSLKLGKTRLSYDPDPLELM